ncbi:NUDIX hydrolase [Actinopolymorpha alba]|uniref:NUDIX hydrolase n=1 Tax=Actinopolymorpha alba TaxID=533267 RepID=UPI0003817257|nr:NUDIX domain-containing protein [Actinopolymorpha alba]
MRTRGSARVLLLDEQDRALMIKVRDDAIVVPGSPVPPEFWVTVGGGVEWGESYEEAVRREVFEETGIGDLEFGPCLWKLEREVLWSGEQVRVIEHGFLGRVSNASANFDHVEPAERLVFREHRWWSLAEMTAAHRETFRPPGLPELFTDVLNGDLHSPITL